MASKFKQILRTHLFAHMIVLYIFRASLTHVTIPGHPIGPWGLWDSYADDMEVDGWQAGGGRTAGTNGGQALNRETGGQTAGGQTNGGQISNGTHPF